MKRSLSLVLALVMILGSFSTVFATDVVVETADAVEVAGKFLAENGVLKGNLEGDLKLGDDLKRRDAVVLLSRLYGVEEEAKATPADDLTFNDITDDNYKGYIAWSVNEGIIEGFSTTEFGFNKDIKAQDFATVVLRVLGYEVNEITYPKAIETATELGVLKDLEVENRTTVTRGIMAVMTFNALNVKINGTDQTLAEKLGIEMPEGPRAEKLEVVEVYTENLGEVVVKYNNAELTANQEKEIVNAKNYSVSHSKVKEAILDGEVVTLVLEEALVRDRNYDLKVRNIITFDKTFKAHDNTAPVVERVEVLGTYGIKVVMSEPIKKAQETKFELNGKNIAMTLDQYGREVTLRPYYKESFPLGENKLTIKSLEDLAGFTSQETTVEIDIKEYKELPEVEKIEATNNSVIVTFNMDVFPKSVDKSNMTWSQNRGRTNQKADDAKVLSGNKVEYIFNTNQLPRQDVEVTISQVENYSRLEMKKATLAVGVELDFTRPEIIRHYVRTNTNTATNTATNKNIVTMELVFDKDMSASDLRDANDDDLDTTDSDGKDVFQMDKYVSLYSTKRDKFGDLETDKLIKGQIKDVSFKLDKGNEVRNIIIVEFEDDSIKPGTTYDLLVQGFRDNTVLGNRMVKKEYIRFREGHSARFYVTNVIPRKVRTNEMEVDVEFSQPVELRTGQEEANYRFRLDNNQVRDLRDLGGRAIVSNNGKTVTLELGNKVEYDEVTHIEIMETIKDVDGIALKNKVVYSFVDALVEEIDVMYGNAVYSPIPTNANRYVVTPYPRATEVTVNTNLDATIVVDGNLDKLTINAPHAHVVVTGNVDEVVVVAIGEESLEITGTVGKITVSTKDVVRVYGNVNNVKLASTVNSATFKVSVLGNRKATEIKVKSTEVKVILADANGKITTVDATDVEEEEAAKEAAKVEAATKAVANLERFAEVTAEEIAEVQELIDALKDGEVKDALQRRLDIASGKVEKEAEIGEITIDGKPVVATDGAIELDITEGTTMGAIKVTFDKEVEIAKVSFAGGAFEGSFTGEEKIKTELAKRDIILSNVDKTITITIDKAITQDHIDEYGDTITVILADGAEFTINLKLVK